MIAVRFFQRPASKEIVLDCLDGAAKADGYAGQLFSQQELGRRPADPAVIEAYIGFLACVEKGQAEFITDQPALFRRQCLFAVKAPDGVSVANAEVFRGVQRALGGLGTRINGCCLVNIVAPYTENTKKTDRSRNPPL